MAEVVGVSRATRSPVRPMLWLVPAAFLAGPAFSGLAKLVEHGKASFMVTGWLMFGIGYLLRRAVEEMEEMVFSVKHGPWLGGRLRRWHRLILPFKSGLVIPTGLSAGWLGATYLLTAPSQWDLFSIAALGFVVFGALLMGFGLSRLAVGLVMVWRAGLWGPSRRAWRIAGALVALGSVAHVAYSVHLVLALSPGV
jgi:hypothetical protein